MVAGKLLNFHINMEYLQSKFPIRLPMSVVNIDSSNLHPKFSNNIYKNTKATQKKLYFSNKHYFHLFYYRCSRQKRHQFNKMDMSFGATSDIEGATSTVWKCMNFSTQIPLSSSIYVKSILVQWESKEF